MFLLAVAGALTGVLLGPRIVGIFHGAPAWLLPLLMAVSVLFALIAAYMAFQIANRKRVGR